MRCVPAKWCIPSSTAPVQIWDDTGSGGGKPGSMWIINSMQMVAVVAGHEPPKEAFFELRHRRFMLDQFSTVVEGSLTFHE